MKITLVNLQELVERGSGNIWRPPIHDDTTTVDNFNIVGMEDQKLIRTINASICIRVNGPSLNKIIDKYHLPHSWDETLLNSQELKFK